MVDIQESNPFIKEGFQNKPNISYDLNLDSFNMIKSKYNNESIAVKNIKNNQDKIDNSYKVIINNQCLTVNGDNEYCLNDCNKVDYKQHFDAQIIGSPYVATQLNRIQII